MADKQNNNNNNSIKNELCNRKYLSAMWEIEKESERAKQRDSENENGWV